MARRQAKQATPEPEDIDFDQGRAAKSAVKRAKRRPRSVVLREKREKFKEIIAPRAKKAIHDIRLLTYGSNRKRYHYTDEDIALLRERLHKEVDDALRPYITDPDESTEDIGFS